MTVQQRLMQLGSFSLRLRSSTRNDVTSAIECADYVIITATPMDVNLGAANILASSIYTGIIVNRPNAESISGHDLSWFLGTPDGKGPLLKSPASHASGTLSDWITSLRPSSLAAGSVTNTGITLTNTYQYMCNREALVAATALLGAEWNVTPQGELDAAAATTLFRATPSVIITRRGEGPAGDYIGLNGGVVKSSADIAQYITGATVLGNGSGATISTGDATGTTSYVDLFGNPLVVEQFINAPTETATSADDVAQDAVDKLNALRRTIKATTRTFAPTRHAIPGDWIYVHDPEADVFDLANTIDFRGDLISPLAVRLYGIDWPIMSGHGVFVQHADGSITDLTPHVEWEDGDTRWEIGIAPQPIASAEASRSIGSAATLGPHPDIAARAATANPPATGSCALTAVSGGLNLGAGGSSGSEYHIVDGRCYWRAVFVFSGAGWSAGTGEFRVSIPVAPSTALGGVAQVGEGWYYSSAGFTTVTLDQSPGGSLARLIYTGGIVGAAAPAAPMSGAVLSVHGDYPIA